MSTIRQRFILLLLLFGICLSYFAYQGRTASFPCETFLNSPLHSLDSEYVREIGRKSRFIAWVTDWYGAQPQEDSPYITWEKDNIGYQAYFNGVDLESVTFELSAFETTLAQVNHCLGTPSSTSAVAVSTDRGTLKLMQFRYDRYRLSITTTAPTNAAVGEILLPDENAGVNTLVLYSIPAYARYQP